MSPDLPSMAGGSLSSLVTMTAKHLGSGSVCPPLADGLLRCYSMKYCPYAQRAHLVLAAKKVKHDVVWVNLKNKPSWLFEKNPLGKVPILEQNGKLMFESLAVCDYLDEMYPNPPLHPSDPWEKGVDKMFVEVFTKVSGPMLKIFFNMGNGEVQAKSCEDMKVGMDIFEAEHMKRGTKYFGGNTPGMLDYMIWPWAERLELVQMIMGEDSALSPQRFPRMIQWKKDMLIDDAVIATYLPPETHANFFTTFETDPYNLRAKL